MKVLAEMQLIFFIVGGIVLRFGFVIKAVKQKLHL